MTAFLRNVLTTEERKSDKGTLIQVCAVIRDQRLFTVHYSVRDQGYVFLYLVSRWILNENQRIKVLHLGYR